MKNPNRENFIMENRKYFGICERIAINVGFSTFELEELADHCERLNLSTSYVIDQIFDFWKDCGKEPKDCNSYDLIEGFFVLCQQRFNILVDIEDAIVFSNFDGLNAGFELQELSKCDFTQWLKDNYKNLHDNDRLFIDFICDYYLGVKIPE